MDVEVLAGHAAGELPLGAGVGGGARVPAVHEIAAEEGSVEYTPPVRIYPPSRRLTGAAEGRAAMRITMTISPRPGGGMSHTREVVERFFERFGSGDIAGAMECFAPECISITPAGAVNNAKHQAAAQALKDALPDSRMELTRVLESDDEIYVTGRFKGTHQHDLRTPVGTIAGSGKTLDLLFVDYFRVQDGKIIECEAVRDRLDMILQLGGSPSV